MNAYTQNLFNRIWTLAFRWAWHYARAVQENQSDRNTEHLKKIARRERTAAQAEYSSLIRAWRQQGWEG